jgi:hypothetical protein
MNTKISKQAEKDIKAYLKECSKLKGAALREAYAEIVGRDTNQTSRERLLNGIARILYHNAGQGALVPIFEDPEMGTKPEAKKETKRAMDNSAAEATENDADRDDDATAPARVDDAAGGDDGPGASTDDATGADIANAGAITGGSRDGVAATKKRGAKRPRGERDPRLPPAGTVLKKTYKGVLHEVTLSQDNGCSYEGKHYKSLSGVAKVIAGCNHNGMLFFGIIKRESRGGVFEANEKADTTTTADQAE